MFLVNHTMVNKGNHPQMAELFRFVNYSNLPRYVDDLRLYTQIKTHAWWWVRVSNVGAIINHPPITIFMGGILTIKNGWFVTLLYPHYSSILITKSGIFFPIGNGHPNWLSYFSEGLKPTTRYGFYIRRVSWKWDTPKARKRIWANLWANGDPTC